MNEFTAVNMVIANKFHSNLNNEFMIQMVFIGPIY